MKRKLRIEELSVASFHTDAPDALKERGTVLGNAPGTTQANMSCLHQYTCSPTECCSLDRTCQDTCPATCAFSCDSCVTCNGYLC